eukprot:547097_1
MICPQKLLILSKRASYINSKQRKKSKMSEYFSMQSTGKKTGAYIQFSQEREEVVAQYNRFTSCKTRNPKHPFVRKINQIVPPTTQIAHKVRDFSGTSMRFTHMRFLLPEIESLDISSNKYGKKSKKPSKKPSKKAPKKNLDRRGKYCIISIPAKVLSAVTGELDIKKGIFKVYARTELKQLVEKNFQFAVQATPAHTFPLMISALLQNVTLKKGVYSDEADTISGKVEWMYVSVSKTIGKISVVSADKKNTKTNNDINVYGRDKQLFQVVVTQDLGKLSKQIILDSKKLLPLAGNVALMEELADIKAMVQQLLNHLIKQKPNEIDIDLSLSNTNSVELDDVIQQVIVSYAMPKFAAVEAVPKSLSNSFFDGWILVDMEALGNCAVYAIDTIGQLSGLQSYTPMQWRRCFYDQLRIMLLNPCVANDVVLSNIKASKEPMENILVDRNWVNVEFMDTFIHIASEMFNGNIMIYGINGKLREDLIDSAGGFSAARGSYFVVFTGGHFLVGMPRNIYPHLTMTNTKIHCALGKAFPKQNYNASENKENNDDDDNDNNDDNNNINNNNKNNNDEKDTVKCSVCKHVIGKKNTTYFECSDICPYNSRAHEKCVFVSIEADKLNEFSEILCNLCRTDVTGSKKKYWELLNKD